MRRQERHAAQMRRQAQGANAYAVWESDRSGGRNTQDSGGRNPRRGGRWKMWSWSPQMVMDIMKWCGSLYLIYVSVVGAYLHLKGVSLNLRASGQKCSRAEVAIRSLKDTARSIFYRYLLPARHLCQLLLLDSLKTLNRRVNADHLKKQNI